MDELLDVVDENDVVVSQETFSVCHDNKLIHRSSMIFVFKDNSFKELLITKRSVKVRNPGKFDVPGGHVKTGNGYLRTAKEELEEEVFHNKKLPKNMHLEELFKIRNSGDADEEFTTIFRTIHPGPFNLNLDEISKCLFVDINSLLNDIDNNLYTFGETLIIMLKEYEKRFFIATFKKE